MEKSKELKGAKSKSRRGIHIRVVTQSARKYKK